MNSQPGLPGTSFNIFCYADDILLTSTTITGLQVMVDVCMDYVEAHGLNFNASKPTGPSNEATLHLRSNTDAEWNHLDTGKSDKIHWGDSRK